MDWHEPGGQKISRIGTDSSNTEATGGLLSDTWSIRLYRLKPRLIKIEPKKSVKREGYQRAQTSSKPRGLTMD